MNDEHATAPASAFAPQLDAALAEHERQQSVIRRRAAGAERCAQSDPKRAPAMGWRLLDLWAQSGAVSAEYDTAERLAALGVAPPANANQWAALAELVGVPGERNPEAIECAAFKWAAGRTATTTDKPAAVTTVGLGKMVTAEELAEALGVTPSAARTWLFRYVKEVNPFARVELSKSEVRRQRAYLYWTELVLDAARAHFLKSSCKVRAE